MSMFFRPSIPGVHYGDYPVDTGSARAAGKAQEAINDVAYIELRMDRLSLVCMALWELLKERTNLTEEDLLNRVRDIDLRDGQLDGKLKKGIKRCPKCDRVMSPRHAKCLYCGAEDLEATAFDKVL